jgi:hypothetical protein
MAIPLIPIFVRRWFARAFNNDEAFDYASLDAQHADLVEGYNKVVQRLNLISTANGTLRTLTSVTSFTATAAQTAFTVPAYETTTDTVMAYTNDASGNLKLIPPASVTLTSDTVVTLPAQTVGATVVIEIFTPGSGTTQLSSVSTGQGASLIGIEDAGGYLTAVNVETALAEIAANLASSAYLAGVLSLTNYIKKDGTVAFTGDQSMGSHKITNLSAGTAGSNDAARMADVTSAALVSILSAYLTANYLPLTGGTLTGDLSLGSNSISDLADAVAADEAVNKGQLDLMLPLAGGTMTGDTDLDGNRLTGLPTATDADEAISLSQAQGLLASFSTQLDVSATGSWVVPAGIIKARFRAWGAGAGGGNAGAATTGGGAGAYGEMIITVVPGETLVLTVGAGGTSGLTNGGNTEVLRGATVLLRCQGGQANLGGAASSPGGATFVGFSGGRAEYAAGFNHPAGGDSPCGGQGGAPQYLAGAAAGYDGTYPGGGGAGGIGGTGGTGAGGRIVIDY